MSSSVSASAGFTRTEALVLALLIAVLVSIVPVRLYLAQAKLNRAVTNAAFLSTTLAQYATDNGDLYPAGEGTSAPGTSEGIARNLLANNFIPDSGIFALGDATPYKGKGEDFADFTAANIGWDFTAGANAMTGINASAPGSLPVVFSTGETIAYAVGSDLRLSGHGCFGEKGIVVAYKDETARFIPAVNGVSPGFIAKDFSPTGTYTQVKP